MLRLTVLVGVVLAVAAVLVAPATACCDSCKRAANRALPRRGLAVTSRLAEVTTKLAASLED